MRGLSAAPNEVSYESKEVGKLRYEDAGNPSHQRAADGNSGHSMGIPVKRKARRAVWVSRAPSGVVPGTTSPSGSTSPSGTTSPSSRILADYFLRAALTATEQLPEAAWAPRRRDSLNLNQGGQGVETLRWRDFMGLMDQLEPASGHGS